jgi:hypothetical protein
MTQHSVAATVEVCVGPGRSGSGVRCVGRPAAGWRSPRSLRRPGKTTSHRGRGWVLARSDCQPVCGPFRASSYGSRATRESLFGSRPEKRSTDGVAPAGCVVHRPPGSRPPGALCTGPRGARRRRCAPAPGELAGCIVHRPPGSDKTPRPLLRQLSFPGDPANARNPDTGSPRPRAALRAALLLGDGHLAAVGDEAVDRPGNPHEAAARRRDLRGQVAVGIRDLHCGQIDEGRVA